MNGLSGPRRDQDSTSMKQPPQSEVAEFLSQIDRLASLLDAEGETFWRAHITAAAFKVRNSDWQGFGDFLSGYGTSGSFNECSIRTGEWQGNNHMWNADDKLRHQEFEIRPRIRGYGVCSSPCSSMRHV